MKLFPENFGVRPLRRYIWQIKPRYFVVNYAGLRQMLKPPDGYRYCGQVEDQALWVFTPWEFVISDWLEGKGTTFVIWFVRWARRKGFLDIPEDEKVKSISDYWRWDFWNRRGG